MALGQEAESGMRSVAVWLLMLAIAIGYCLPVAAAESYRYRNEKGVLVLDYSVPPEYVKNGYEVLGPDGRVLRRVLPQSEIEAQAEAERRQAALAGRSQRTTASDLELVSKYRSVEELERARDRKLEQLERAVSVERANLDRLREQRRTYERHGADLERGGQPVPPSLISDLVAIEQQIRDREGLVIARAAEKESSVRDFGTTMARLKALLGG